MASSSAPVYNGSLIHLLAALPGEKYEGLTLPELAPDLGQRRRALEDHEEIQALYLPIPRFLIFLVQERVELFLAHAGAFSNFGSYAAEPGVLALFRSDQVPRDALLHLLPQLSRLPLEEECRVEEVIPSDIVRWEESYRGRTPLHFAAQLGDLEGVRTLLEAGASPNQSNLDGYTPLHDAIRQGHKAVARMLIDRGGDPTLTTAQGESALHLAVDSGNEGLVTLFLQHPSVGRWIDAGDSDGKRPLHRAVWGFVPKPGIVKLIAQSYFRLQREEASQIRLDGLRELRNRRPAHEILARIAERYRSLLATLFQRSLALFGPPPSRYALITYNGLSRGELSLSSPMKLLLLVEREEPLFCSAIELFQGEALGLGLHLDLSIAIQVDGFPMHTTLLVGERSLLERLPRQPSRGLFSFWPWRREERRAELLPRLAECRAGIETRELYSSFEQILSLILLYFGKEKLTIREGVDQLPLKPKSRTALRAAWDRLSFIALRNELMPDGKRLTPSLGERTALLRLLKQLLSGELESVNLSFQLEEKLIHRAARAGAWETLFELVERGEEIDAIDDRGRSPLHLAAAHGQVETVRRLLERLGNALPIDDEGATPLHEAAPNVIELLLRHYSPQRVAHLLDNEGRSALYRAVKRGSSERVSALFKWGQLSGSSTESPLDLALEAGDFSLFRLMILSHWKIEEVARSEAEERFKKAQTPQEQLLSLIQISFNYLDRKEYRRAALLLNSALAIAESAEHKNLLLKQIEEVERRFIIEKIGPTRNGAYRNRIDEYKGRLRAIRSGLSLQRAPRELLQQISQGYTALLGDLFNECVEIVGQQPPTSFAMIALGSLSRQEACPYSDVEFVFLVESSTEEVSAYFRRLSELMILKITNFGESEFKMVQTSDGDKSLIPKGFSVDSGLSPLGKEDLYELIQTPEGLASFQTNPEIAEAEFTTVHALRSCSLITGSQLLLNQYKGALERILTPLREAKAIELIQAANKDFEPKLDEAKINESAFDVKKELYRLPQMTLHALALYHGISANSTFDQIDQLRDRELISIMGAARLKIALEKALFLRIFTHLFYHQEKEVLYFPKPGEKRVELLLNVTPELSPFIIEIYRTLVPLHERAEVFIKGDRSAFADSSFYSAEVGKYDDGLRETLQFDKARESAVSALALNLHNPAAHVALGAVDIGLGQARVALDRFEEAYHLLKVEHGDQPHPHIATILNSLGSAYDSLGEYHRAIEYLQQALIMRKQIHNDQPHSDVVESLNTLGTAYDSLGECECAIDYCQQALTMNKQILGDRPHSGVADSLNTLGTAHYSLGEYERAIDYCQQALTMNKQILGDRPHPRVASSLMGLGTAYDSLGEYERAIDYHQQSLAIKKKIYGDRPHPGIAAILNYLGSAYDSLGEYHRAIDYYQQALAMEKQIYGDRPHPCVASSLVGLGTAYKALGECERAIEYHQQALAMSKQIHGDRSHPSIAGSLINLSNAYNSLGEYERAIDYYQQSLAMQKQILGDRPHPNVASSLINLSNAYNSLGEYERAIDYCQQALTMNKQLLGDRPHPGVASSLINLGNAYDSLGEYERAIDYYQQALTMNKQILGDRSHPHIAAILNNLGSAYKALGEYERAIDYYQQSLAMQKQIYGDRTHSDVATGLMNLGNVYNSLGKYERAIDYHQQSLAIKKKIYGDRPHPDVAASLNNLGNAYDFLGEYERAIEYHQQALAMLKQIYGDRTHSDVATGLMNLGNVYNSLGKYERAIEYHQQALAMRKQIYGDRPHSDVATGLMNLGNVYNSLGKYERAIDYYQQALAMRKQIHSDRPHPDVAASLNNLGSAYDALGDYSRAIEYHQQSLAIKKQIHGDRSQPDIASSLNNLGTAYRSFGDYSRAIDYYQQSLAMQKQIHSDRPHSGVANSLMGLGNVYNSLGEHERAIDYYQQALAMQKQTHGDRPHSDVADSLNNLGCAYDSLGEYHRAIEYHQQALAISKQIHGEQPHTDVAGSLNNLGCAYDALGEYARAIEHHQQALAMQNQIHGDRPHSGVASSLMNLGNVHYSLGEYHRAIEYHQQALAISKQILGDRPHPDVVSSLMGLGNAYKDLGEYHRATDYYEQALAIRKQIHSDQPHTDIAGSLNNLGVAYYSLGDYSRAIEYYEQALAMQKQIHGDPSHPETIKMQNNLNEAYKALEQRIDLQGENQK